MPNALRQSTIWRDGKGNTAASRFWVSGSGTVATQAAAASAVIVAMNAITGLALQSASGPSTTFAQEAVYPSPVTGYDTAEDKAVFVFQTAAGTRHSYAVPGPLTSIFLADLQTVNPANAGVIAYVGAVIANVTNAHGDAVAFFVGGVRRRGKNRRKLNIFVLTPSLTASEPAE
jgi:hypothetical protein